MKKSNKKHIDYNKIREQREKDQIRIGVKEEPQKDKEDVKKTDKWFVIDNGVELVKEEFRTIMTKMGLSIEEICYNLVSFDNHFNRGVFDTRTMVQFFVKGGRKSIDIGKSNVMTIVSPLFSKSDREERGIKGDNVGFMWRFSISEHDRDYWKQVC